MRADIAELFELDPALTHLNHGAFGAVPRVVREAQDRARARIEAAPMRAFRDELPEQLAAAREAAATFLGVAADSTCLVRNVSEGVATVLEALRVGPGDDVVVSDHGYPTASMAVAARGGRVVEAHVGLGATDADVVAAFAAALTPETRLVVVDQVTSPTAAVFPVAQVVAAVHPVPVLVDAAHVPGALPGLDVEALGADFWVGNLHKWAFAARGTAALWVAPAHRERVRPLVTSWSHGLPFPASFDLQGTVDHSAWAVLPEALRFWHELGGWERVARDAQTLTTGAAHVRAALAAVVDDTATGTGGPLVPPMPRSAPCMTLVSLPEGVADSPEEAERLWQRLYAAGFVVPPVSFAGRGHVRLAAGAYTDEDDFVRLADELTRLVVPARR